MPTTHLHYNPFTLTTANAAWSNKENSPAIRVVNTALGAVSDICVKNPYNLTIGNAKYAFFSSTIQTRSEKAVSAAIIVLGSLYSLMLYGASSYLAGRSLVALGSHTKFPVIIKISSVVGHAIQNAGEKIFLSGAVPLYGFFYALPKKIIETIPRMAQLIAEKVSLSAQRVFNHVLAPIWNHAIRPLLHAIHQIICTIGTAIYNTVEAIASQITQIARWVFQNLIQPIWTHIIEPTLNLICKTVKTIASTLSYALRYIATQIAQLSHWIIQNVLTPLWNQVISPLISLIGRTIKTIATAISNSIQYVATKTAQLTHWIVQNVLTPLWNQVISPLISLTGRTIKTIATAISNSIQYVATKTAQLTHWIVQNMLTPLWNQVISPLIHAISTTIRIISTAINRTVQFIAAEASRCAGWIFKNILVPTFNAITFIAKILLNYAIRPAGNALYFIAQKIASFAHTIFNNFIFIPTCAVGNGAIALGHTFYEISNAILENISSLWRNAAKPFV